MSNQEFTDHYEVLEVHPTAPQKVIERAYRRLASRHHPDRHPPEQRAGAEERMKLLNCAWAVLRDPKRRAAYDQARVRWIEEPNRAGQEDGSAPAEVDEASRASPAPADRRSINECSFHPGRLRVSACISCRCSICIECRTLRAGRTLCPRCASLEITGSGHPFGGPASIKSTSYNARESKRLWGLGTLSVLALSPFIYALLGQAWIYESIGIPIISFTSVLLSVITVYAIWLLVAGSSRSAALTSLASACGYLSVVLLGLKILGWITVYSIQPQINRNISLTADRRMALTSAEAFLNLFRNPGDGFARVLPKSVRGYVPGSDPGMKNEELDKDPTPDTVDFDELESAEISKGYQLASQYLRTESSRQPGSTATRTMCLAFLIWADVNARLKIPGDLRNEARECLQLATRTSFRSDSAYYLARDAYNRRDIAELRAYRVGLAELKSWAQVQEVDSWLRRLERK